MADELVPSTTDTTAVVFQNVSTGGPTINQSLRTVFSTIFDFDESSGVITQVVFTPQIPIDIRGVTFHYTHATSGTVAAGTASLGVAGDVDAIVDDFALEDSKAVGYMKECTLLAYQIAAGVTITATVDGVAATAAGKGFFQIDYVGRC